MFWTIIFSLFLLRSSAVSIGDRLDRSYTDYVPLPLNVTAAVNQGWQSSGACQNKLGIPFNYQSSGPQESSPFTLYFSRSGQVTGLAATVYGGVEAKLLSLGYFIPDGSNHRIIVTFSNVDSNCNTDATPGSLGDYLIINAQTLAKQIPVEEKDAISQNWHAGSCFAAMGTHYFYDLQSAPKMSWQAENVLPIVPMYNNGVINAFFFTDTSIQQSIFNGYWWDPVALPNYLMCYNFCDSDCTFAGTSFWSTGHIFLRDYTQVTCPGGCQTACCSK